MKIQTISFNKGMLWAGLSALCIACTPSLPEPTREQISLQGNWGIQLDTLGVGISINQLTAHCTDSLWLPGTTDLGKKGRYNTDQTQTTYLSREYIFEGEALYTKSVRIPESWAGQSIRLVMERTKPTTLWIDGKEIGSSDDITTAQCYDVSAYLSPGEHNLAIRVNNGNRSVPTQVMTSSHAYSSSTQTNWNGIIGQFYLEAAPICSIESIQLYPDWGKRSVTAKVTLHHPAEQAGEGTLSLFAEAWNTNRPHKTSILSVPVDWKATEQVIELPLGPEAQCWSEFDPALYRLTVSLRTPDATDTQTANFGMREFRTQGRQFTINGKTTFLRGKHDACVFPLTAHTAMDVATWRHYFQVAKQYGINHYRFHSWCPPEACFEAADIEGIYLQPELPIWGNIQPTDEPLCNFLLKEGRNLHQAYSNHASFVMFALGNEMSGEEALGQLIRTFKAEDNRHIYASGSNNYLGFQGKQADEDYFTTCRVGREEPQQFNTHTRGSFSFADAYDGGYINHSYPNSTMSFASVHELCEVPIISHETGQFQVYPNYEEMQKYTGVLLPRNFAVFKQRLEEAGMSDQAHDFFMASGKWSAILYRADIEMNLRTPDWGGFQLLDLQDYPGQGSAYVGILDAFMDSKGLITPEAWREFCCEVVPLFCTEKFCWNQGETLTGQVAVANYSAQGLEGKTLQWTLTNNQGEPLQHGSLPLQIKQGTLGQVSTLHLPLQDIQQAEQVTLTLTIEGTDYRNSYPLWVYPNQADTTPAADVLLAKDWNVCQQALAQGKKVLWIPDAKQLKEQTVGGLFQTDYWNFRMFKTICENLNRPVSPGTMGLLIQPEHPALAEFPTEFHTNWQWFPIVKQSYPLILDALPDDYRPIVQVIDNIERNHKLGLLFEFQVGTGKLLICMSDLRAVQDKPEARQFYQSLLHYMASDQFAPQTKLTPDQLKQLITQRSQQGNMQKLWNISSYE